MNLRNLILLFCLFLVCGCATQTKLVSVGKSSYRNAKYNSIIVWAPYDDLIVKERTESLFWTALRHGNLNVYQSIDVFPPLRQYSNTEIRDSIDKMGIQVVLVVGVTDFWKTFYNTGGHSETTLIGNTLVTNYFSGITLSQSNVKLDVRLLKYGTDDVPETIWRSNSQTSGDYFTDESYVMKDAAKAVALKIMSEGILMNSPQMIIRKFDTLSLRILLKGGADQEVDLGVFSVNDYEIESVYNKYGLYGFKAKKSLWHPCGLFASPLSDYSACNPDAKFPPVITNGLGKQLGYLSVNDSLLNNYKVSKLRKWLLKEICKECENDSL